MHEINERLKSLESKRHKFDIPDMHLPSTIEFQKPVRDKSDTGRREERPMFRRISEEDNEEYNKYQEELKKQREQREKDREERERYEKEQRDRRDEERRKKRQEEKEKEEKERLEYEEKERERKEKRERERRQREEEEAKADQERKERREKERHEREELEARSEQERREKREKEKTEREQKLKEEEEKLEKEKREREEKARQIRERIEKEFAEKKAKEREEKLGKVKQSKIVFVIGGPGSGKGTQCDLMVDKYGFCHLSIGELLRDEVKSGSQRGKTLEDLMIKNERIPNEILIEILKDAMADKVDNCKGFLIDGYPRQIDQGVQFEEKIGECEFVLYVEASDDTIKSHMLKRSEQSDNGSDNEATKQARLEVFHQETKPVIEYYENLGKLRRVNSEKPPIEVFADVERIFNGESVQTLDEYLTEKAQKERERKENLLKEKKIVFVVGGPGSGKGTQCDKMNRKFGYTHISSGDLLRDEVKKGTDRAKMLNDLMQKGQLVPNDIVLDLIKEAMLDKVDQSNGYLIDGYPRQVDQGIEFEKKVLKSFIFLINIIILVNSQVPIVHF